MYNTLDGQWFSFVETATASDVAEFPISRETTKGREGLRRDFDPVARPEKGKGMGKPSGGSVPEPAAPPLRPVLESFLRSTLRSTASHTLAELTPMAQLSLSRGRMFHSYFVSSMPARRGRVDLC